MGVRWQPLLERAIVIVLGAALGGCSGGSEETGRIHVTAAQVIGVYKLGPERVELRADGTYVQKIDSDSDPLQHLGRWRIVNHFLDGSEVVLDNAAVMSPTTPEDQHPQVGFGDLRMYAHRRDGKVALASNEVADWYYQRLE